VSTENREKEEGIGAKLGFSAVQRLLIVSEGRQLPPVRRAPSGGSSAWRSSTELLGSSGKTTPKEVSWASHLRAMAAGLLGCDLVAAAR
jgi:hypothetical protein